MMNFQQTDAIGGLLEGIAARQKEEQNFLQQQNTMQQMQKAALEAQVMAAKAPHEIEGLRLGNLDKQSVMDYRNQQTDESKQRVSRENAKQYISDMIQFGDTPGAEDFLQKKYGVQGHPVTEAFRQAKKRGEDAAMMSDQVDPLQYVRMLQEKIAMSDDKSRQATATAEAQDRRTAATNARQLEQERMRQEGANRRAEIMAQAKQAVARLAAAAAQFKNQSLNQYAAKLLDEAEEAARSGNEQLMLEKRQQANDVLLALQAIAAAPGNAQRADEAQRLYVLTQGRIDMRGQVGSQPGAGPGTPAPTAVPPRANASVTAPPLGGPAAGEGVPQPGTGADGAVQLNPNQPTRDIKQTAPQGAAGRTKILAEEYAAATKPEDRAAIVREFKVQIKNLPKGTMVVGLDGKPYKVQ